MIKIPVYNLIGEKAKDLEISSRIFGRVVKSEVVHQAVVAQAANSRQVLAHTKTKGEVSGGGKKPWKQKGTGRARHGSSRSPLWVGGGVTFGPNSDRNFSKGINQKQKQVALAMCLTDKLENNALAVFEEFKLVDGKTKELNVLISSLKSKIDSLKDGKKFLLILAKADGLIIRAAKNLDNVKTISADSLNCVDVLKFDRLIADEASIAKIESHYKKVSAKEKKKLSK